MKTEKVCKGCGVLKPLTEYYTIEGNKDGRFGTCKICIKTRVRGREIIKKQDPEWLEKERERGREKFHRLYKGKKPSSEVRQKAQITYRAKYPEKDKAKAAVNRKKTPIGMQNHHWSYNKEHRLDTILITLTDHATAHRFMIYDQERMMYRTKEGILLDTKEAHVEYINQFINEKISLITQLTQ
jgi:hypothetical protein